MPHTNEQIYSLEMSVRHTKNNVIAHYDHSQKKIADLEKKLLEACTFVESLKQSNETLEEDKFRLNIDLKLEILFTDHLKKLYKAQMMKETKDFDSRKREVANRKFLEADIDTLRKDKKRKRQEVGAIWERIEGVGLDK